MFWFIVMRFAYVFILAICADLVLYYGLEHRLLLGKFNPEKTFANLLKQWLSSGIRWVILYGVSNLVSTGSIVLLRRLLGTHCLLGPIFWTGRMVLLDSNPLEKSWFWLFSFLAAASSCLFWELSFPDDSSKSNGENTASRELLKRVILLYKHDYALLFGAFVFLSLAVLCK